MLALLWLVAELIAGEPWRRGPWGGRPAPSGHAWPWPSRSSSSSPRPGSPPFGFTRLSDEARRSRDLLVTQTLRDAVLTAGGLMQGPADQVSEGLLSLSRRIDAELVLYSGGALANSSAPLLEDLGILPPLLAPEAFATLA